MEATCKSQNGVTSLAVRLLAAVVEVLSLREATTSKSSGPVRGRSEIRKNRRRASCWLAPQVPWPTARRFQVRSTLTPMRAGLRRFFDTANILLISPVRGYRLADRAEAVLARRGTISVQVLNEFAAVATRKLGLSYPKFGRCWNRYAGLCRCTACAGDPRTWPSHRGTLPVFDLRTVDRRRRAVGGMRDAVLGRFTRRSIHRRAVGHP